MGDLRNIYYKGNPSDEGLKKRHEFFVDALEEFDSRNLRKTLFKSYQEYMLFIDEISNVTGISNEQIISALEYLIVTGEKIEFEDLITSQKSTTKRELLESELNQEQIFTNYFDEINPNSSFSDVFGFLGSGLVIRFCKCNFKDFSDLKIKIWNERISYSKLCDYSPSKSYRFPYIYYQKKKVSQEYVRKTEDDLRNELRTRVIIFLNSHYNQEKNIMGDSFSTFKDGKMIRDAVHGDIFIPKKYLDIVNCRAFQRLRRIRQLATADYIFPEAVHTRFAHSLGTFHIMTLLMDHFCEIFKNLHIAINNEEKDAILVAALLHDIGHGPYSHAYETLDSAGKKHEDWTIEIIQNDPELKEILKNNFGYDFYTKVISCITHKNYNKNSESITLTYVMSELISSNLDADRMDYLMRDSQNTGEKYEYICVHSKKL